MNLLASFLMLILPTSLTFAEPVASFTSPLSTKLITSAMTEVYGNYDAKLGQSKIDRKAVPYTCKPDQWIEGSSGNGYILVSCLAPGDGCHACAPTLGILNFGHSDEGWELRQKPESGTAFIQKVGSSGQLPPAKIRKVGSNTEVLEFDTQFEAQGTISTGIILVSVGKTPAIILSEAISGNNHAGCGSRVKGACYAFETKVSFDAVQPGYGPITLRRVDTKPKAFCYKDGTYSRCKNE